MNEYAAETHWEKAASTRMGTYLTNVEMAFFLEAIDFSKEKLICDVGAEAGKFSLRAIEEGANVVALDIDAYGLGRLKAKSRKIDVICADGRALPLRSGAFDAAVSMEVIDYIPQLNEVLAECKRILRNGCPLVFSSGNKSSLKSKVRQLSGKSYIHSYGEIMSGLHDAGFAVAGKTGFNWLPFGRMSQNILIPFLGKVERLFGFRRLPRWSPWILAKAVKTE